MLSVQGPKTCATVCRVAAMRHFVWQTIQSGWVVLIMHQVSKWHVIQSHPLQVVADCSPSAILPDPIAFSLKHVKYTYTSWHMQMAHAAVTPHG
jgi:hypothetical protein